MIYRIRNMTLESFSNCVWCVLTKVNMLKAWRVLTKQ